MKDMIYRRRSVRKYRAESLDEATISDIFDLTDRLVPLYPEIKCKVRHATRGALRTIMPWFPKDALLFYSEEAPGYLENAGFMMQQLDLALQKKGLGTCWVGLAKPNASAPEMPEIDGMKYVIMLSIGYTDVPERKGAVDFNRRELCDISDCCDKKLEPARIAPSSTNSQPWYFKQNGSGYDVYYHLQGVIRSKLRSSMHYIDIGIALSHLYVSNPGSFRFFKNNNTKELKNCEYIGSFSI